MKLVPDLEAWLKNQGIRDSGKFSPIEGGCISQAFRLDTSTHTLFIKQKTESPSRFFEAEAEGLGYLHSTCNLNTPEVLGYGRNFIVLNYIASGTQGAGFWDLLAEQLATLHNCTRQEFGFVNDNFIGETPQINTFCADGYTFYSQHRLRYQARRALSSKLLDARDYQAVLSIADHLQSLVPAQPASLLHGDLWSGNVHVNTKGQPVFIDPAVYYGWAESELAMTCLFGGFPERFYQAYREHRPALKPDWKDRVPVYNLYHLLNHLNLFGGGYYQSVRSVLDRYA